MLTIKNTKPGPSTIIVSETEFSNLDGEKSKMPIHIRISDNLGIIIGIDLSKKAAKLIIKEFKKILKED